MYYVKNATYLQQEHAERVLSGCPDSPKEDRSVNRSKEGPVEPPTTLGDEFGNRVGHIRGGFRALDILQSV